MTICLQTHMERDFILSELDTDSSRSRLEELMHPEYEMPWEEGEEEPAGAQEEYEPNDAGKSPDSFEGYSSLEQSTCD